MTAIECTVSQALALTTWQAAFSLDTFKMKAHFCDLKVNACTSFLQRSSAIVDVWGWLSKHLKDVGVATLTTIHLHVDCAAKIEICERDENMAVNGKKDNHGDTVFIVSGGHVSACQHMLH